MLCDVLTLALSDMLMLPKVLQLGLVAYFKGIVKIYKLTMMKVSTI